MAGVVAMVADGIATCVNGLMFFALIVIDGTAKCDSYWLVVADVLATMWLADFVAMVADGIDHCWNVTNVLGRCYCEGAECVVGVWSYVNSSTTQILPL